VLVAVAVACAAIGTAAGYAYAVAQTANQDYTGCLLNGEIHFVAIGDTPLQACPPPATQITRSQTGPQGPPGPPGTNGTNGTNGKDGVSPNVTQLVPGNAHCGTGGAAITDASGNTAYVCNGTNGKDGQPFSGTFTSPSGLFSMSVTDGGITLTGPSTSITLGAATLALNGAFIALNGAGCTPAARQNDLVTVSGGGLGGGGVGTISTGSLTVCIG
jgi:hypothetical protein